MATKYDSNGPVVNPAFNPGSLFEQERAAELTEATPGNPGLGSLARSGSNQFLGNVAAHHDDQPRTTERADLGLARELLGTDTGNGPISPNSKIHPGGA